MKQCLSLTFFPPESHSHFFLILPQEHILSFHLSLAPPPRPIFYLSPLFLHLPLTPSVLSHFLSKQRQEERQEE